MTDHSGEPGNTSDTSARPGLRRLVPLLAAAGVLATVGGGYLASTGWGEPAPLRLGPAAQGAELTAGLSHGRGEPASGGLRLELATRLPAGPASGQLHRLTGSAEAAATVGRLATALGLGPVRTAPDGWVAESATGRLRVADTPGHPWNFQRERADDRQRPADRALQAVLSAVGLERAAAVRGGAAAGTSSVLVRPAVAGLPTEGVETEVVADLSGVRSAHGWLLATEAGDSYPLVDAETAYRALGKKHQSAGCPTSPGKPPAGAESGGPVRIQPVPPSDPDQPMSIQPVEPKAPAVGQVMPPVEPPECRERTLRIDRVTPGLALSWQHANAATPLLVPAWLFDGSERTAGQPDPADQARRQLAEVSVAPRYLLPTDPDQPLVPPVAPDVPTDNPEPRPALPVAGEVPIDSAARNGRELTVRFFGGQASGACRVGYRATVSEHGDKVTVGVVRTSLPPSNVRCAEVATARELRVTLARPVGDRRVLDASDGHLVSR